jgi:hypothetical protein
MSADNAHSNSHDSSAPRTDAEGLLAEIQQVFAEVIAGAEARMELSDEQREQAELVIEQVMDSTRRMIERLATAEP